MSPVVRVAIKRLGITFVLSVIFAFIVSEVSYQLVKNKSDRLPEQIEIQIPAGTAEKIAQGLPGLDLPDMTFVEGDSIVVYNDDSVSHQLGPIWIPPNASSTLTLDRPSKYTMECTFEEDQAIDLEVLPRAKASDRVMGVLAISLPTWVLVWLYSLVAIPLPSNPAKPSDMG